MPPCAVARVRAHFAVRASHSAAVELAGAIELRRSRLCVPEVTPALRLEGSDASGAQRGGLRNDAGRNEE